VDIARAALAVSNPSSLRTRVFCPTFVFLSFWKATIFAARIHCGRSFVLGPAVSFTTMHPADGLPCAGDS
jgi:hypothetical protein